MAFNFVEQDLTNQKDSLRYRSLACIEKKEGNLIKVAGKEYLNFSSNDYLGLAEHPNIVKAMQEGVDKFGASACSSNLITGYQYAHQALENDICQWLNKPRCLLYSSGFAANVGVLDCLGKKDTHIWLDKLSHASLIDGAYSSSAKTKRFLHNDIFQLDKLLTQANAKNNLVVTEGVFSMDGDQAKLNELEQLKHKHNSWLYCDDAHSIGVVGARGQGSSSQANIDIIMATFGKAVATSGAFIACEEDVAEYLLNFSRHYIFSTAISPAIAWATKASINIIQKEQWRREKISQLSTVFSSTLDPAINLLKSDSSIHALVIGSESKTLYLSEQLKDKGFWITAIRPPTVPVNSSRLRVTINSLHKANEIKALAYSINEALNK